MNLSVNFPQKHKAENNQQYVYRALFHSIMSLELEPGQQISEPELSDMLSVSRTPVREAIVRLVESRLVDVLPQRSTYISRINLNYVEEGVFMRCSVESAVMPEAIRKATESDIYALKENLRLQRMRLEEKRYREYVEHDDDFHRLIYMAAGKPGVWSVTVSITTHLNRLRRLQYLAGSATYETGYAEHCRMLDMITAGETADISGFIRGHVTSGYTSVLPYLKNAYPDYFE